MNHGSVLAVSIGDPAGIGGEIAVKAFSGADAGLLPAVPVIVCDAAHYRRAADICGIRLPDSLPTVADAVQLRNFLARNPGSGPVLYDCRVLPAEGIRFGEVLPVCGRAAYTYIARAAALVEEGLAAAVVTGPINKESLQAAQVPHIGHTEIFGSLTGTADPLTMFETLGMRIFFLSRHVSLAAAVGLVTAERVYRGIRVSLDALASLGDDGSKPLAVAGLNPHCGEHGLFGEEDDTAVRPAVERAVAEGLAVSGPIGADSVFHQARIGRYSAVLSLYHDQGHIAAKTLDFERTVSVTLGMPYLRTSVDHGTAFDIAGSGQASPISLKAAFEVAARYAPAYTPYGLR